MLENNDGSWGRREFLKATGVVTATAATCGIAAADPGSREGPPKNELLVGITANTEMATAEVRIQETISASAEILDRNDTLGYLLVKFPEESSVSETSTRAAHLRRVPGVKYVEENATYETFLEPDDEHFSDQYAPRLVNAPQAWDTTLGSDGVTIAIIDTGVKYDHADLESRFGATKGRDFIDADSDPIPDDMSAEFHGTHVAGIASGETNNGTGVAGMSNSTLLSGRVLSEFGRGSTAGIVRAIQWATDQGADLINMSLGGGGYQHTMKDAVSYAFDNGALSICAAGNDGSRNVSYPAAYEECVAVSAIDSNEDLAYFSNYGPEIDVAAPGVDVLSSSTRYGGYERLSGTSMACPATTGVAALGLATHPNWTPSELRAKLKETAVDIGLPPEQQGAGRVDAAQLVGGGGNRPPKATLTYSGTPRVDHTVTFRATKSHDPDGEIVEYRWEDDDGDSLTGETVEAIPREARTHEVTLTVTDDDGGTDSTTMAIDVLPNHDNADQQPIASVTVSPATPTVGETITLDASQSAAPHGEITAYDWSDGDDRTYTGETVEVTASAPGDREISLTVTDETGETTTLTKTVRVSPQSGTCGTHKHTETIEGTISNFFDSERFEYTPELSNPCQVTVSLDGPDDADFDLFATADGRTPTFWDHDSMSATPNCQETVVLEDVEAGRPIGILVDCWAGNGSFTVSIEEIGR